MTRFVVILNSQRDRAIAKAAIDRAPPGYAVDIKEAKRSDKQNRALWGLLHQIQRQRPTHNGVQMTPDTWKAVFLQALGAEMVFVPTLDGTGMFPLGHRSSQLTKSEFAGLLELMLAWCAEQKIDVEHFDGQGAREGQEPSARAA